MEDDIKTDDGTMAADDSDTGVMPDKAADMNDEDEMSDDKTDGSLMDSDKKPSDDEDEMGVN